MAENLNDKLRKTGAATVTTLSAPGKALGASSITVGSTTNYPTDAGKIIAIRQVDTVGDLVSGTYTEWKATVASATSLTIDPTPVYGSDRVYPAGSTTQVYIPLSSFAHNEMIDAILAEHSQTGAHTTDTISEKTAAAGVTIDGLNIKDGALTTANSVPNSALAGGITPSKLTNPYKARVYLSADQTINDNTETIIAFNTENYDPNSNYASNKYTAAVAGYYQVNVQLWIQDNDLKLATAEAQLFVNGMNILKTVLIPSSSSTMNKFSANLQDIIYLNAGDYVDVRTYGDTTDNSTFLVAGGSSLSWLSIHLLSV